MMNFDREDIRKLIYFFWESGLSPPDICKNINSTHGQGTVSVRTCQRWVSKFNDGKVDCSDAKRSGRPSLDLDDQILQILEEDKYSTTRQIAEELGVCHETVRKKLNEMGKRYLVNKWIPYRLSEANKLRRKNVCEALLSQCEHNNFLLRLITVDEVWIYWENDERSRSNRSWVTPGGDGVTSVARNSMTSKKHMAIVFWDARGILHVAVLPVGQHVTSAIYCEELDKMKESVCAKRRRADLNGFYFLQDNARPHTSAETKKKLSDLGLRVLDHPPYSPDLSPSDYYLFSPMKNSLTGKSFRNADEVMTEVNRWFESKDRAFFTNAFTMLPNRWRRCIDADGNYFQHLAISDD